MRAPNIKLLTDDERKALKMKYYFDLQYGYVVTKCIGFDRTTKHDADSKFSVYSPIRKITFSPAAVGYWKKLGISKYHLIDVQQAVNMLAVTYQDINLESVKMLLDNNLKL